MDECKPIKTPMPTNGHLDLDEGGNTVDQTLYHSMIGSLLYFGLGIFTANRKPNRTAPHRTEPKCRFSVCGSVSSFALFGVRLRLRFYTQTKPINRCTSPWPESRAHTHAPSLPRPQPTMAHQGIKPSWRLANLESPTPIQPS